MIEVIKSVKVLRLELRNALNRYGRAATYDNALAVQKAKKALNAYFKAERAAFFVMDNPNPVPNPNHVPPKTWRIIYGDELLSDG